ncbi:MAG: protein kinase [Kofleriaceae bacterium]
MGDTCDQIQALIQSQALAPEESARLEAHLASCDACREHSRTLPTGIAATGIAETMQTRAGPVISKPRELADAGTERYRVTGEVGRGGLGRVLRAQDSVLDRPVALKELFSTSDAMRGRFVREALITARLQHPSIVPVYDAGQLDDRSPFYAMKLVAGRPLDKAIAEATTLPQRLALLPTVLAVADAMAYAHSEQIIHRDLKPANILVGRYGETIVIDWGLAKDLTKQERDTAEPNRDDADGVQTVAGTMMGTPAYMAPEQAAGEAVDARTDVYALGALLYQVVSGAIPHEGNSVDEMVRHVLGGDVRPLTERVPDVPRDLAAIVTKAMALEPAKRYPNAQGFADDLRRYSTGQLVASHTYRTGELLRRWLVQHRGAVTVAAAALVVVGAIATLSIRNIVIARADATASREVARLRLAASYVDHAGTELVTEQPARALAYTIASAQIVGLTDQTRLMAARALDQLPPLRWWSESKGSVATFIPGTHDLVLTSGNELVRWSCDTDRVQWRAPMSHGWALDHDTIAITRDHTVALIASADAAPIAELAGSPGVHYNGMSSYDTWVAAAASDRIDLFDTKARSLVASIPFANAQLTQVTADGQHVIVYTQSRDTIVLDRAGTYIGTFKANFGNVIVVGNELVYATPPGANGLVRLAVADATGNVRLDLPIGISPIDALAVDGETKRIALGTEDGVVQLRSLETGEALWQATLAGRAGAVTFDGPMLRVASSSTVVSFDIESGIEVERASVLGAAALSVSDDHTRTAALVFGTGYAVWQSSRSEVMPIAAAELALAPNGTVIAAGQDGELREIGASTRRLATGKPITSLSRLDDGTLITTSTTAGLIVRDRDGHELRSIAAGVLAAPSPDGHHLAVATATGAVAVFDLADPTNVRTLGTIGPVYAIRWSPDGRFVAALATAGALTVWDGKGVVRESPKGNFAGAEIAFSADSKWLARSGEPADTLYALDGGKDRTLLEAKGAAVAVAFTPDTKTVLVAGLGFVSTWDIATGAPRVRIATNGFITAAAFVGSYIIAGGMDQHLHVWNADTGAELIAFTLPARPRKIVVDHDRIAILTARGATIWTLPMWTGSLDELRAQARCSLDLEVTDGHLQAHAIDRAACQSNQNRMPTEKSMSK